MRGGGARIDLRWAARTVSGTGCSRFEAVRTRVLLGLAFGLALPREAAAQTMAQPAQPGATAARRPERHPPAGLGGTLTVGRAGMSGTPTGWLVRLDYELFPVLAPSDTAGPILGFHVGWEVWRAKPDWGLSLPMAVVLGVRAQPVRATLGVGFDALIVDVVNDDTGVGLYAPFACARVGGDIRGIQLGADARITRRWQFGAPDHTQWQLGVFAGGTWESKHRGPRY